MLFVTVTIPTALSPQTRCDDDDDDDDGRVSMPMNDRHGRTCAIIKINRCVWSEILSRKFFPLFFHTRAPRHSLFVVNGITMV